MTVGDVRKHYTDDGEFTARAEYPIDGLPDGEEISVSLPVIGRSSLDLCGRFDRFDMADTVSPETRSRVMSRVRGHDTRPEMYVRRAVWAAGFRYRLHVKRLPGSPDLVLSRYRLAVFVHGCFWHQHGCRRARRPSSNQEYWDRKLDGNLARDASNRERLEEVGWSVATIWECDLDRGIERLLALLASLGEMNAPAVAHREAGWVSLPISS